MYISMYVEMCPLYILSACPTIAPCFTRMFPELESSFNCSSRSYLAVIIERDEKQREWAT